MKKVAQKQVVKAFIRKQSIIVSAMPNEAVAGFSRGVSQALGVSFRVCFSLMKQARLG